MKIQNATADPMGAAIYDYHKTGKAGKLIVHSSMFEDDEIPVADLFRTYKDMPRLEQKALELAQGRILDVGAGSGCHSSALKQMGKEAHAIDGTGIIRTMERIPEFFSRLKMLLKPGGSVIIDSSDLCYLFEEEDGSMMIDLAGDYYGQLDYRMEYKGMLGEPFDWLYLDFSTLHAAAEEHGFKAELLEVGDHYDYLALLSF